MNFSQFILILRARYKIILSILVITVVTTLAISLLLPKTYKATTALLLNYKGADPVTGVTLPAQLMPGYMATQVDIINSPSTALKVVNQVKLADSPVVKEAFKDADKGSNIHNWLAEILLKNLEVEPSRDSNVINVSFKGSDPEFVAAIANGFANAYQEASNHFTTEPAQKAAEYLGGQVKILRTKYEEAQSKLTRYQQEKGIVSVDNRSDVESARLNDLSTQLVLAQGELMGRSNGGKAVEGQGVINNPLVNNIKASLVQAESKLAESSQKYGRNHPTYQGSVAEVERLRAQLNEYVNVTSRSVASREAEIRAALAAQKNKVLISNRERDELNVLSKEADVAQRAYDAAWQRLNQITLEGQSNQSGVTVLNAAIAPTKADSPKIVLNMLLSIFLGTLLGLSGGMLVEMLDRRVRSVSDMLEAIPAPVLGVMSWGLSKPSRLRLSRRWPAPLQLASAGN
ncbi:MAG: chain length determinant protein EpsF [Gallionellaceae bacterium]|nr:chain length determinant protein EpsF [Gallionellaceae bacterium]